MRPFYLILVCILLKSNCPLFAQEAKPQNYSIYQSDSISKRQKNYVIIDPPNTKNELEKSEVRVIVRFTGDALSNAEPNQRVSANVAISNLHQRFLDDLEKFDSNPSMKKSASSTKILFDYREVYNGYALITTPQILEEIKKLPYVNKVSEDKEVKLTLQETSRIINAPKVWEELKITGKGITIGIIDTGIDYNHPDLGGGFGPGFKVIGGYDFVNNDSDPIDDHSHGTHVAGIAAGNGSSLKGVAPGASLVAYKVLNQQGSGHDSWILAAIERSVDPDQNPATQDALDVVNMSLGRVADDNEPLSEAVNNAVSKGVVFVIAAGNSSNNFSISTPAIAEKAITVGATDNQDNTADFSSKGPIYKTFALKPDIAAPGVNIYSSTLNNKYVSMSGTSMASPHVAGAAALLLEQQPDWSPELVKAALMNTAKKSDEDIWNQGAGRIDVYQAIKNEFVVTPASFSLGAPSGDTFEKSFKATVYNKSNTAQDFDIRFEGNIINPNISASISSPSFSLGGKMSKDVDINFIISTSSLEIMNFPDAITGFLVVSTASKTVKSPIILVNPQKTTINYEDELPLQVSVFGTGDNYFWNHFYPTSSELELYLPVGKYDMITRFNDNYTVVTEDIITEGNRTISISKRLAKNLITFKPLDELGRVIPVNSETSGVAMFTGKGKDFMLLYLYAEDTFYISDQNTYRYDMAIRGGSENGSGYSYDVNASTGYGIFQSKVCSNDPSKFLGINIYTPSKQDNQGIVNHYRIGDPYSYMMYWDQSVTFINNPLRVLISETPPGSKFSGSFAQLHPNSNESGYIWETPVWKNSGNNILLEDTHFKPIANFPGPSFDYHLGSSMLRYSSITANASDRIVLFDPYRLGNFHHSYGEHQLGMVYFKLFSDDNLIKEGNFENRNKLIHGIYKIEALSQPYKMTFSYDDYQVQGRFGNATAEINFNTALSDKDAPHLSYLSLEVAGKSVDKIKVGEAAHHVAKVEDICFDYKTGENCTSSGVATVNMYLKKLDSDEWEELNISSMQANEYHAILPASLPEGYYSYKIVAKDRSDNSLSYELKPGFLVGDKAGSTPYSKVKLLEPLNKSINAGTNPNFLWSTIPSASYTYQLSETQDFTSVLLEVATTDESYNIISPLEENKTYYWRIKAKIYGTEIPWSEIFSFYSGSLKGAKLLSPVKDAKDESTRIQFKWSKVDEVNSYIFELSLEENFKSYINYSYVDDTSILVGDLLPGKKYFWRVTSIYVTWDHTYQIPSETFSFRTRSDSNTEPPVLDPQQPDLEPENPVEEPENPVEEPENPVEEPETPTEEPETPIEEPANPVEEPVTSIDESITHKSTYNYPNPFTIGTYIVFNIDIPGKVSLTILDPLGRFVNYIEGQFEPGTNSLLWKGTDQHKGLLPEGIYYGILKTPKETTYIKMIKK